jgi:TonB-dependent SusC/RagA subfamily outer membrane receptor
MNNKKKILRFSLLLSIVFLPLLSFISRTDFLLNLNLKLKEYTSALPVEKVYLHIDKPIYFPGEDIWLKAYLINASNNTPSDISEVVYVELVDPRGNIIKKLTLPAQEGMAHGDFNLKPDDPGGLYKLRAYTLWMRNFGDEYIFEKKFHVQHFIAPNLLITLDFEKENYSPGETITARFVSRDLEDNPIEQGSINYTVQFDGKTCYNDSLKTDSQGKANLHVDIPDTLQTRDALLTIHINHQGLTESISRAIPIALQMVNLKFYPEGGYIVNHSSNSIAFEALNEYGKPVDIEALLYSKNDSLIARVKSFHMGMGKFTVDNPSRGMYVKISSPIVKKNKFHLPEMAKTGYQIQLHDQSDSMLYFNVNIPYQQTGFLVGQMNGNILYDTTIIGENKSGQNAIPIHDLPAGILQFTLFNSEGMEECERLVFVNQRKQLKIKVETDKDKYNTREKVALQIETSDAKGNPVSAHLSLAAVDDRVISFADDKQDHLLSYLLLSSELKGKIEEPQFYFDPEEAKATAALDLLMMTHGWRRFTWAKVVSEPERITFFPENFSTVNGIVVNAKTNKPVRTPVYLLEMNNQNRIAKVNTNQDGIFKFYQTDPTATIELIARSKLKSEKNWKIVLNTQIPVDFTSGITEQQGLKLNPDFNFVPEQINQSIVEETDVDDVGYLDNSIQMQPDVTALEEVVVVGYGSLAKRSITGSITVVHDDNVFSVPYYSIQGALSGRVAGVMVTETPATPGSALSVRIRGMSQLSGHQPIFVVDGLIIQENEEDQTSLFNYVHPDNIQTITVLKAPEASAIYGSMASNGAILIETKKARNYYHNNFYSTKKNYTNLRIKNHLKRSKIREYYVPNYSADEPLVESDLRQTILWKHDLQTNENGQASLEFHTNDALTTFKITTEGVGNNGLIGRNETTIASGDPVNLDIKLPSYLSEGDTLKLPVQIHNISDDQIDGTITMHYDPVLMEIQKPTIPVTIPPNTVKQEFVQCVLMKPSTNPIDISAFFHGDGVQKKISKTTRICSKGFPVEISLSGSELKNHFLFILTIWFLDRSIVISLLMSMKSELCLMALSL